MIKCIIVEDEPLAQNVIQSHLAKTDNFELVAVCNNALEAKEALTTLEVDLMFLDIQLPGMTGLHFLRTLASPPLVVLTTAHAEYAVESYEYNIIDYLLKPVSYERFCKAINKIADGKSTPHAEKDQSNILPDHLFIKSSSKLFKIKFSEIVYVEGMRDYLKVHIRGHTLVTLQTMNDMTKSLPDKEFIRVHKSYIIALSHVISIGRSGIQLENITIPVGKNYKEKLMATINKK
ncbi:MAG: LytTR family DNA-binding domain-containing protein [Ginsengibacter sp.]